MRTPLLTTAAVLLATAAFAIAPGPREAARAGGGGMAAILIDMDPGGAPANTATSLGSNETCARINENGALDADEDISPDTITVDVTATGIPASTGMIGYNYELDHDQTALTVQSVDTGLLLANNPGSSLFITTDPAPDPEAPLDNRWKASALDTGFGTAETGSGVLDRLMVSTDPGVGTGDYQLSLAAAVHIDAAAVAHAAGNATVDSNGDTFVDMVPNVAKVSVNKDCATAASITPSPSPTPIGTATPPVDTPIPTPTPTPTPAGGTPTPEPSGTPTSLAKGDNDCDGDVDTVDALKTLRYVAALDVSQTEPCTDLGQTLGGGIVTNVMGDMDCDGDVDAVDAMRILRYVAVLANSLPEGCPEIGV